MYNSSIIPIFLVTNPYLQVQRQLLQLVLASKLDDATIRYLLTHSQVFQKVQKVTHKLSCSAGFLLTNVNAAAHTRRPIPLGSPQPLPASKPVVTYHLQTTESDQAAQFCTQFAPFMFHHCAVSSSLGARLWSHARA